MDKKFVVFLSEQELKRHFVSDHGDELKMTRAQRREAFSMQVQLQYRGRDDSDAQQSADAAAAAALHERATVVIGGGQGLTVGRMGQRGGALGMHHSRSEPSILSTAIQVWTLMPIFSPRFNLLAHFHFISVDYVLYIIIICNIV